MDSYQNYHSSKRSSAMTLSSVLDTPTPPKATRMQRIRRIFVDIAYKFLLLPLNACLIAWIVFMMDAYLHPTSRNTTFFFRQHGLPFFNKLYAGLIAACVAIGLFNVYILYSAYRNVPRRWARFRIKTQISRWSDFPLPTILAVLGLLFLGAYAVIASLAFRDVFRERDWRHACDGYEWMAEVKMVRDFPARDNSDDPVFDASSTVSFRRNGEERYRMDLIRAYNQSLGFGVDGSFTLALRTDQSDNEDEIAYFNTTDMIMAEGMGKDIDRPGPIASVQYWPKNWTYVMTLTESSAPGFPAVETKSNLTAGRNELIFPEYKMERKRANRAWRFTDNICLPPRVEVKERLGTSTMIFSELARDCYSYRICGLKKDSSAARDKERTETFEDIWPTLIGPIIWEFENYSLCCRRGE